MKKINLILIALMALIFVSCSEDETTMSISKEANAVAFSTYTGRSPQTRGAEMTDSVLQGDDGFGVLAYYTNTSSWNDAGTYATPNFMWNQQVTYATDKWTYNPIKYWPTTQGDKVSFFAYAPYENTPTDASDKGIILSGNAAEGTPTITFTVQDNPGNMVDLVTASVMDVVGKKDKSTDTPKTVEFKFQHALSRVNFFAKASELLNNGTDANKTIINITDVQLDESDQFYKSGVYTLSSTTDGNGEWTDFGKAEKAYTLTTEFLNKAKAYHGTEGKKYNKSGIKLEGDSAVKLFKDNEYLFLIPPAENGLTESGVKVTFTYDIVTIDTNLVDGYSKTTATKTVALPEGTLQQGVAYNYTFTFKVDQVVVTAEVADWGKVKEDGKVDVDYTHPN